jgi:hypothetical protein
VENKNAQVSEYLESITPKVDLNKKVKRKARITENVAM